MKRTLNCKVNIYFEKPKLFKSFLALKITYFLVLSKMMTGAGILS